MCTRAARSRPERDPAGSVRRCWRRSARVGPDCPTCPTTPTSCRPTRTCWSARGICGCGWRRPRCRLATAYRRSWPTRSCRPRWPGWPRRSCRTGTRVRGCWSTERRASTSTSRPGACRCGGSCSSNRTNGNWCSTTTGGVLRYRTQISKARRRAHRALSVLRRSIGDVPISEAVEESARWLEEFHPRSIVELDYGGLAAVLSDQAMTEDDSPSLVAEGLSALAKGDAAAATRGVRAAGRPMAGNSAFRAL